MHTFKFNCPTADDTKALAAELGRYVNGGEVVEFISDLGGGKTTFVKGLAVGMGVTDVVQSPTFTLSQLHRAARGLELHHFDFYRLDDAGVMAAELAESLSQNNAVVAVEWGEIVHNVLPKERLTVKISSQKTGDERVIDIHCPAKFDYLAEPLRRYQQNRNLA